MNKLVRNCRNCGHCYEIKLGARLAYYLGADIDRKCMISAGIVCNPQGPNFDSGRPVATKWVKDNIYWKIIMYFKD